MNNKQTKTPLFKVGDEVQIRNPHRAWDNGMKKISKVLVERARYVLADDSHETTWPESALKPYALASPGNSERPSSTPPASSGAAGTDVPAVPEVHVAMMSAGTSKPVWQLPPPLAGMKWKPALAQYWQDAAEANLKEAGRERARADKAECERDQLRKELEEAQTEMSEARELMPIVRRQDFLDASLKEAVQAQLVFMNERLNYIHELEERASTLTTENAALKEKLQKVERERDEMMGECDLVAFPDGASNDEVITYVLDCARRWMPAARIIGNARAGDIARALDSLRSQFRWTPVSERLPTEKDADKKGCVWIWDQDSRNAPARPIRKIHWKNLNPDDGHAWITPIPLPLSPPETEEQTMRREFEGWFQTTSLPSDRSKALWLAWQAAKQSTGGKA